MSEADDRTTALGLFHYARSYWVSGDELDRARLAVTHREAPVTYLLYHAIELYLKAFLRCEGMTVKELRNIGHKVGELANAARLRGLHFDDEDGEVVKTMNEYDVVIRSRYIVTGFFSRPTEEALSRTCRSLDDGISSALEGRGIKVRKQAILSKPQTQAVAGSAKIQIGFEQTPLDVQKIDEFYRSERGFMRTFRSQDVCRIWVENSSAGPVSNCRVVLERITPTSPVKSGVLLVPDNRGAEKEDNANFDLAATERRYLKFLRLEGHLFSDNLSLTVKTEQDENSFASALEKGRELQFGNRYEAAIALHAMGASSCRIVLAIDAVNSREISVTSNYDIDK